MPLSKSVKVRIRFGQAVRHNQSLQQYSLATHTLPIILYNHSSVIHSMKATCMQYVIPSTVHWPGESLYSWGSHTLCLWGEKLC